MANVTITRGDFPPYFGGFGFHNSEAMLYPLIEKEHFNQKICKCYRELSPGFMRTFGGYSDWTREHMDAFAKYYENITIPPCTYAVFETEKCAYPTTIFLDLRRKIASEWLPNSGYQLKDAPELVVTHWFEGEKRNQRYRELWIPIEKK